jgi:hypothetical protein
LKNAPVGGSRFWFGVPFQLNFNKNVINLNCD